jgi:SAM-dependent methyltransferase
MTNPWDENSSIRHNQLINGKDITFSKLMVPEILRILKDEKHLRNYSLFDIGCGTGVLTHILAKSVKSVIGVDLSSASCEIAKSHTLNDENVQIYNFSIEDEHQEFFNTFNIAISHMVFQTMPVLEKSFICIYKYLKKRGKFIFSIPHPCFFPIYRRESFGQNYSYHKNSIHSIEFIISNDRQPLPSQVPYYHRPISMYTNLLHESGFYINNILEPFPNKDLLMEYQNNWEFPRYMIFICNRS